ncbi:helix-turn-helix domain-containing protein [Brevundimonas aurantiaca]|uniref:helix-turn-helix domain-containing protein n=1 Tax=Brevundimonas aurantiaca TaxID=74316 RepID=UPI001749DEF7|nr:helix-turn-helix transcriptional regulator [Brevundimonas aurantiaca]
MNVAQRLTPMEAACLRRVRDGLQSKEIALELGRSAKTIDKHIENACRKLGVSSRRQAARLYFEPLRDDSVGASFPLPTAPDAVSDDGRKGGLDAALGMSSAARHMGGAGGDLRGFGGDERGTRDGSAVAGSDTDPSALSLAARFDARDTLHRARSPQRERSAAKKAGVAERVRELAMIPIFAAVALAVLAAILGGSVQLQLAVQALDRLLSGR